MNKILTLVFLLCSMQIFGQSSMDSLWNIWSQSDTTEVYQKDILNQILTKQYYDGVLDSNEIFYRFKQNESDDQKIKVYKFYFYYYYCLLEYNNGRKWEGISALEQGLKVANAIGDERRSADVSYYLSGLYGESGQFYLSSQYIKKALPYYEREGDYRKLASAYAIMANLAYGIKDRESQLKYSIENVRYMMKVDDSHSQAQTLHNLGYAYQENGNYDSSLKYYSKSLLISEAEGFPDLKANALCYMGETYMLQNQEEKAMELFLESLEIQGRLNMKREMGWTHIQLGKAFLKKGSLKEAIVHCETGLKYGDETKAYENIQYGCECLYHAYWQNEQFKNALLINERLNAYHDSTRTIETAYAIQGIEFKNQQIADSLLLREKEQQKELEHIKEVQQKTNQRNIFLGTGVFVFLLSLGLFSRLRYVRKSKAIIESERDRSENLLLNILPEEVAQELKEKGKADARDFEEVSILFTDFVSFTEKAEKLSAKELVEEINECFEAFDGIIEKYKVEKIKTIGDAYMAAGGLPVPTPDSVKNTALAALEMQEFIIDRKSQKDAKGESAFEMRVGIHTGPVVAGIVGVKKFQYDIWGDTVNTASRMESNSEAGKVNISQTTYELIKDETDFEFESRGKIDVKGKGLIEMWYVKQLESTDEA